MKSQAAKIAGMVCLGLAALVGILTAGCGQERPADLKRGEYLVKGGGCSDCHTPLKMGASGPEPDPARFLSGHPESMVMPAAPKLQGPWMGAFAATMTAWAGPWGISFTANLTPDKETGLGQWTAQTFVDSIRSGRLMGRGRELLPPMPVAAMRLLTDEDLKAMFAYLRTIPAIGNRVPDPVPPGEATR